MAAGLPSSPSGQVRQMCGIAGYSGAFERPLLERMSASISHRGPDDHGLWTRAEAGIGLAHRRLAIVDLSPHGHQPMLDDDCHVVLVFNGEIYNHLELRRDLERDGARFRSRCDAEVLLHLYRREGDALLARLNGIFAFALWDARERRLLLARDGLGVKPLYHASTPRGFVFASELKALLHVRDLDRELDVDALRHHLAYLWAPAPETLLRGVRKLEPGQALSVRDGRIERSWYFYDLPYGQPALHISVRDAMERVKDAVRVAVERQLDADVEIGAFLSGGMDSSSIVAFAAAARAGRRLTCFSIGFRDRAFQEDGFADDLVYARKVASHCRLDLEVVEVGPEMVDRLESMIWHLDEPTADPAGILVQCISERARAMGIKVLLSGAGGEDLFSGLRRHQALQAERLWGWWPKPVRAVLGAAARALPVDTPAGRRVRKAFQYASLDREERLVSYFYWTHPATVDSLCNKALLGPDRSLAAPVSLPLRASLGRLPSGTPSLHRMLYLESKHFLADHNLNYTDKMGMAAGVEIRVPLLDRDLVDLAVRLPARFKQRGAEGKWIFKKAMRDELPVDVIDRPKTGFGAPIRRWLRQEWRPLVEDALSQAALTRRGWFEPPVVRALIERDRLGREDASFTLFELACLELWARRFLDKGPPAAERA